MPSLGPLTIAVVAVCLVAVFVVLVVGINRCRSTVSAAVSRHQSNLEDKTACSLTKSNSYKSSPSGKNSILELLNFSRTYPLFIVFIRGSISFIYVFTECTRLK